MTTLSNEVGDIQQAIADAHGIESNPEHVDAGRRVANLPD